MPASYEVCLLTSPVRNVMSRLRKMVSPLYRLHHKTLDCVELHYSEERDALLLRLCFSELHLGRDRQRELVQCLAESGFEVLESSEITASEKPRFEQLLRDQYEVRIQQYPSPESPSVISKLLDSLAAQLEPPAIPSPEPRPDVVHAPRVAPMPSEREPVHAAPRTTCVAMPRGVQRLPTVDALEHIIAEIPMFEIDVEGSKDAIELVSEDERASTLLDDEPSMDLDEASDAEASDAEDALPLRMETFGPLDDMIAKLPRAKTQESLDSILDKLWP